MRAFRGVVLFTAIEIAGLIAWLALAQNGETVTSAIVLAATLFLEHYVSVQVGAGRPVFGPLPPDKE